MRDLAYYNEIDPFAAQWLRNLIAANHICPGEVDERSINDVRADDIRRFTQCHFFAGIGVWSHALRLAGWPDDQPVWTGSCPCQPFSAAGKGAGFDDERHLWPAWHHLIAECGPPTIFGEQVASKDGLGWLDLVLSDLEAAGYACGAVDMCAAGVGAPHIRQRLWLFAERMADAGGRITEQLRGERAGSSSPQGGRSPGRIAGRSDACRMGDDDDARCEGDGLQPLRPGRESGRADPRAAGPGAAGRMGNNNTGLEGQRGGHQAEGGRVGEVRPVAEAGEPRRLADLYGDGCGQARGSLAKAGSNRLVGDGASRGLADADSGQRDRIADGEGRVTDGEEARWLQGDCEPQRGGSTGNLVCVEQGTRPGPTNGYWRDADWLFCRDGKWRAVEPGTFPLAHGATARVGRLRAYGNAISPWPAKEVIEAFMECRP